MNDALQELERSTDATRQEWVAGEIERLSAALATAEATIAAAREQMEHVMHHMSGPRCYACTVENTLDAYPSSGVLAEHDAKVLEEFADIVHSDLANHIRERAQVIREGKTDV